MIRDARTIPQFGLLLRIHRLECGLKMGDLAARMNAGRRSESPRLHRSTISRLESANARSRRTPSHELVTQLADALELEGAARFRFYAASGYWECVPSDDQIERIIDVLEVSE